jgi:hypothetical protein
LAKRGGIAVTQNHQDWSITAGLAREIFLRQSDF